MITKKELCECIVNTHTNDFKESEILGSSTLAVAAEHLGLIKDEELKKYAADRGGVIFCGPTNDRKAVVLSLRDILSLLPE